MSREVIMTALFNLVAASSTFTTASRRLKLWTDVAASDKPAIFVAERGDTYTRGSDGRPAIVVYEADIFIYTNAGKDKSIVPAIALNNLIDAVDAALAPSRVNGRQSLGGLVSHCWIEGKILKDPGDLDGDVLAIIPVKILATV